MKKVKFISCSDPHSQQLVPISITTSLSKHLIPNMRQRRSRHRQSNDLLKNKNKNKLIKKQTNFTRSTQDPFDQGPSRYRRLMLRILKLFLILHTRSNIPFLSALISPILAYSSPNPLFNLPQTVETLIHKIKSNSTLSFGKSCDYLFHFVLFLSGGNCIEWKQCE